MTKHLKERCVYCAALLSCGAERAAQEERRLVKPKSAADHLGEGEKAGSHTPLRGVRL